jgi:hypothetical protein
MRACRMVFLSSDRVARSRIGTNIQCSEGRPAVGSSLVAAWSHREAPRWSRLERSTVPPYGSSVVAWSYRRSSAGIRWSQGRPCLPYGLHRRQRRLCGGRREETLAHQENFEGPRLPAASTFFRPQSKNTDDVEDDDVKPRLPSASLLFHPHGRSSRAALRCCGGGRRPEVQCWGGHRVRFWPEKSSQLRLLWMKKKIRKRDRKLEKRWWKKSPEYGNRHASMHEANRGLLVGGA